MLTLLSNYCKFNIWVHMIVSILEVYCLWSTFVSKVDNNNHYTISEYPDWALCYIILYLLERYKQSSIIIWKILSKLCLANL